MTASDSNVQAGMLSYLQELAQLTTERKTFLDIRFQQRTIQEGIIRLDGLEHVNTIYDQGIGLRVVHEKARLYKSLSHNEDLPQEVHTLIREAQTLNDTIHSRARAFQLSYARPRSQVIDPPYTLENPLDVVLKELHEIVMQQEHVFTNAQLSIKFTRIHDKTSYASSDDVSYSRDDVEWVLLFQLKTRNMEFLEPIAVRGDNIFQAETRINDVIGKLRFLYQLLPTLRKPRIQKTPMVASPESAWTFLHETIGHAAEADNVLSGDSYFAGKLGQKLTTELISIIDDPNLQTISSYKFDDEGVKAQGTLIIEDGILNDLLTDRLSAGELSTHSSGNARASTYRTDIQVRQSSMFLETKDASLEELLESRSKLLYAGTTQGAHTDIFTGIYQIAHQWGYIVEKGEIKQLVPGFIITGQAIQTLNQIYLIGKEAFPSDGYCIKGGDPVPIGSIVPHFALKEVRTHWN